MTSLERMTSEAEWLQRARFGGPGTHAGTEDRARFGRLLGAGIWLFFLGNPLGELFKNDDLTERYAGVVALVIFVPVYLHGLSRIQQFHMRRQYGLAWTYLAILFACFWAVVPGADDQSMTCLVFIAALAMAILPTWQAFTVVGILFAGITAADFGIDGWSAHGNNFAVLLATAAVFSFRLAWQRQAKLMMAERDLSELAVEEERARIARDLHDILGHSLTVITVKAELAQRLIDVDPIRARTELADLERLSRDALADVRRAVEGYRDLSLPGELARARAALEAAEIRADLPNTTDDVPTDLRELFAWTVREGVTNVIRHSHARTCRVTLRPTTVEVADDGEGASGETGQSGGSGLSGLRERAAAAGATVVTRTLSPGFSLSVVRP